MAELSTLARPYAKAAFSFANEQSALSEWSSALATLAAVVVDPKVSLVLENPAATNEQQVALLKELLNGDLNEKMLNLLEVLADNKRLSLLAEVSTQFDLLKYELEKELKVVVESAYPLTDGEASTLADKLRAKFGREVSLTSTTNPALIAGAIIRAGDVVIDGSVKGKLAKLAEAMNS
jgi:F-type H+-transporting ATPase subunit delta